MKRMVKVKRFFLIVTLSLITSCYENKIVPINLDDDKDGIQNAADQCLNSPAYDFVDSTGCTDVSQRRTASVTSWRSAPNLLDRYKETDLRSLDSNPVVTFNQLVSGAVASAAPERSGLQAAHWLNLPNYPTIHTTDVPNNWCGKQALTLDWYSSSNLGEVITVGVANNAATQASAFHVNDYFLADIKIDWSGWKRISIPLSSFKMVRRSEKWKLETPFACGQNSSIGWDHVAGLYLFSKAFSNQPHPKSEFYLGDVWLGNTGLSVAQRVHFGDFALQYQALQDFKLSGTEAELFDTTNPRARWCNHSDPEIKTDTFLSLPVTFGAYFRNERALQNYFPRYQPGYVNFTTQGVPTIFSGGNAIQYAQNGGKWQVIDLAGKIAKYAKETLGYTDLSLHNAGHIEDSSIRFDTAGDIYLLAWIGNSSNTKRDGLLLHKSVKRSDWDVYTLPYMLSRFEKFVGHNVDAFQRAPVIYLAPSFAPTSAYLVLPEKNTDGTLNLGKPQLVCEKCAEPIPHSGEGTQVLSDGDDVYVVYSVPILGLDRTDPISIRGLPTYIKKYNRTNAIFSAPVLLGYGGTNAADGHNWAVLAMDSKGIIHVIINGHHDPFVYTKSTRAHDITEWTTPITTGGNTSYLGLVIDKNDTLYAVSRNSTERYRFDLALHRLRVGGSWEVKHLVSPWKDNYHIWFHNLVIDPITQRLFLSYNSQATEHLLFADEIEMLIYQRPDFSPLTLNANGTDNFTSATTTNRVAGFAEYDTWWDERAILTSSDGGDNWRFALSQDLQAPAACRLDANLVCQP